MAHALTDQSPVGDWLDHPIGGPLMRAALAEAGQEETSLRPVRGVPLAQLVAMSRGRFPQELVSRLVTELASATPDDGLRGAASGPAADRSEEPGATAAAAQSERFAGKTVIVTGAASGIGRATAARVLAEGGRVVAVDLAAKGLMSLVEDQRSERLVTVVADITDADDVAAIVAAAGARVDGLANVAGIMDDMSPLHEVEIDAWRRVFSVNVEGIFALSKAVLPLMLEARAGAIVNVASEAALRGNAAGAAYTASKHAVVGLTKSSAFMYGPAGIRVNAVAPGPVATGIEGRFGSEFARERLGEFMAMIPPVVQPERLAASITWLLSDDSDNVNGVVLASDGGWSVQ